MNQLLTRVSDFLFKDRKSDKSRGLTMITVIMMVGILAIIITCYSMDCRKHFGANLGLSIAVSCAAVLCGAFMGFLFGIPRSLQRSQVASQVSDSSAAAINTSFADNTNLEQISDWLTKIIVGVSLTQLPEIRKNLYEIAYVISNGFECNEKLSLAFAYSILIFYSISGFIYSYLWTRINLKEALNGLEKLKNEIHENKSSLESIKKAQFEKEKLKIKNDEKNYSDIIAKAKPEQPTQYDDPQKNRWGGKTADNDRKVSVKVAAHDTDAEFDVELTVESTNSSNPLLGDVYFFLHDSYPDSVEKVVAENGKAVFSTTSYEAFTVGVVCDDGKTKLEIDINEAPNVPSEYKYEK